MWILEYTKDGIKDEEFFSTIDEAKEELTSKRYNGYDGYIFKDEDLGEE